MAERIRRILQGLATHVVTGLLTFLAMYGVANIGLVFPVGIFEWLLLYSWVLTLLVLPIQAGVQIWSLLQRQSTPLLLTYYFQYDATHNLPHRFLDPVQSRIGLATVLILLIGGLIAWPIYAVYGAFLLIAQYGPLLLSLEFIILFIQGLAVGTAAIFVAYFLLASFAILILQWRRRAR
ncbi:MAG: hypothetical protein ACFE89_05000 [Candidatus Hodarchaeota archaeon]